MGKGIFLPISVLIISSFSVEGKIGIIVNKDLYPSVRIAVETYIEDLQEIEEEDVWLNSTTFSEANDKKELKDSLIYHYENDDLEGAILIGDLPLGMFESVHEPDYNGDGIPDKDIFPCDLYYMDMDGEWTPEDMPNTHEGDTGAEIWISRLTCSVLKFLANATESHIITSYFNRVHKRMYGRDDQPRTYLIAGMYWEWSSLESENKGDLDYASGNIEIYRSSVDSFYYDSICAFQWKMALIAGKEYAYVYSHAGGSPVQHRMGYYIRDIYNDATNCRFYHVYCCQNARYTGENMCGAYTSEDQGLVSLGAAKSGSMRPGTYRRYNEPLGDGKCFGEAFKNWFNRAGLTSSVENNISWHYGQTVQGVGTLHLQPYDPVTNQAPTDITFSGQALAENDTTKPFVGTLVTTDPDSGQTHTFTLVNGIGDTDNVSFTISNDTLWANASFDFETNANPNIRVRTTDNGNPRDYYEKVFTITIIDINEAPTDINFDNLHVSENTPGATVGKVTVIDQDTGDTHSFIVNDTRFEIATDTLKLKAGVSLDCETEPFIAIEITATDSGGLTCIKTDTITVTNVNEAPTDITLNNLTFIENTVGATIGNVSVVDPDANDTHTFTVNDIRFEVAEDTLKLHDSVSLDYETEPTVFIEITAVDGAGLAYGETLSLTVINSNEAPIDITIDNLTVNEKTAGAVIGNIGVTDPDTGDTHTYTIDDYRFEIVTEVLKLKDSVSLMYDSTPTVPITITATDKGALPYTKDFTVVVEKIIAITSIEENSLKPHFIVAPNPVIKGRDEEIIISFNVNEAVDAALRVYDAVGNLVYTAEFPFGKSGRVQWNLKNLQGRNVAQGTYIAILKLTNNFGAIKVLKKYIGIK